MALPHRPTVRTLFLVVLTVCAVVLAGSYLDSPVRGSPSPGGAPPGAPGNGTGGPTASPGPVTIELESQVNASNVSEDHRIRPGEEITVVATQGFYVTDEEAEIVAFNHTGDVVYHNDSYRVYFDVDPVPGTKYTVEYVAAKHLNDQNPGESCSTTIRCTRNVVERVNLSTGAVTTVYAEKTPRIYSARWHDVDRINETHLAVADIVQDRMYVVDTSTGEITWQWRAEDHYPEDGGGKPGDWTHINDVEVLEDGRFMVSNRNFDQVAFLNRSGVIENWSLGEDDAYETLHEQHNPDFIPPENGGPAVLVGDSENNRVIEYQRLANGSWAETWSWRDVQLQWPRDADRLPDGDTLVVDSNGDRVMEITPDGDKQWVAHIGMPYDAERLGTGDESTGGPAAASPGFYGPVNNGTATPTNGTEPPIDRGPDRTWDEQFLLTLKDLLPPVMVNGILYVSPTWVQFTDLLVGGVALGALLLWGAVEFRWSRFSLRSMFGRVVGRVRRGVSAVRRLAE